MIEIENKQTNKQTNKQIQQYLREFLIGSDGKRNGAANASHNWAAISSSGVKRTWGALLRYSPPVWKQIT